MTIKEYVALRKNEMKQEVLAMVKKPCIAIVQINEDPASYAYIKGKLKDAAELGIEAELIKLPLETTQEQLFRRAISMTKATLTQVLHL